MTRSAILDKGEAGGELAVRLAIGEAQIIQENRDFFQVTPLSLAYILPHYSNMIVFSSSPMGLICLPSKAPTITSHRTTAKQPLHRLLLPVPSGPTRRC